MHLHKIAAQILLILSIFNLVFAAPVIRETHDAHDNVVPVVVVNVTVMSKERRKLGLDESTPPYSSPPPPNDSTMPSTSSSPPPDGPTRDGSMTSHSPPPLSSGSTPLYATPTDEVSLDEGPTPPSAPASLAVSSPPAEIVPAMDRPVTADSETVSSPSSRTSTLPIVPETDHVPPVSRVLAETMGNLIDKTIIGGIIFALAGGSILFSRLYNPHLHHRTIDPDWYVSTVPTPSADALTPRITNVPTHDEIFLSSTVKGPSAPLPSS